MENLGIEQTQIMIDDRVPKFGWLAGIGAISTYLFASLPLIIISAILVAMNSVDKSNGNGSLNSDELNDKINDLIKNPNFLVLILAANCIGLFIWAFLVSRIRGTKNMRNDFGLKFSRSSLWFLLVGIGLQIVGVIFTIPISLLRDGGAKQQQIATDLADSKGYITYIFAFFVAFIVPFAEELCFRGIFLRGLLKKARPMIAILISGILFGLIHVLGDPNAIYGLSALLLVGIFSSALTVYRGRIDASIALHIGFNLTASIFLILS